MELLKEMSISGHENVLFCNDGNTGLKAIIAIHSTKLGPSLGGTRMWHYSNEQEAINDVLRLSRGMTYKSALANLPLGGGKAVIIGNSRKHKSKEFFHAFGNFINRLNGSYISAEDVGITTQDIKWMSQKTKYVTGKPIEDGGGGDPSPITAYGVYIGMKAAAKEQYGNDSLYGKTILVQGCGHVGSYLIEYLLKEGAKVKVTDIFQDKAETLIKKHTEITLVDPNRIYSEAMDIYAPCALGGTINSESIPLLKCNIIAGAANNQLLNEEVHGELLRKKGILYAPDYLINSGGIINCYSELGTYNKKDVMKKTEEIFLTANQVFKTSIKENMPTYLAANNLAESRFLNK